MTKFDELMYHVASFFVRKGFSFFGTLSSHFLFFFEARLSFILKFINV